MYEGNERAAKEALVSQAVQFGRPAGGDGRLGRGGLDAPGASPIGTALQRLAACGEGVRIATRQLIERLENAGVLSPAPPDTGKVSGPPEGVCGLESVLNREAQLNQATETTIRVLLDRLQL